MPNEDLEAALEQIEAALGFGIPIGASDLPPDLRYFRVLAELRKRLCPQATMILLSAEGRSGDIATIISDTLLSAFTGLPLPIATISRHLAAIGIEKFCKDQNTFFKT